MADQIPDSTKSVTDRDRDAAVDLAHALGLTAEQFTSGADVIIAQALARHVAAPPAMDREAVERKFWLIIREPGRVPDRKGPWPLEQTASILREFMAANPNSFIDYLTIGPDGSPYVDHGPEVLQMADGRSMSVGRKHNDRVREAAIAALSTLSADAIRQGEGLQLAVADALNAAWALCDDTENGDSDQPSVPRDAWKRLAEALDALEAITPKSEQPCWPGVAARLLAARDPAISGLQPVSGHAAGCGVHDDYSCDCIATPASHASDGGKA